jgi:hypothetical protein
MNWTRRFWTPGEAELANLRDETIIDRAPYDARKAVPCPETPAALGDREAHIPEEIKRRQIALAVRYVAAVRAR